jgi:hypothetical protein
MTLRRDVVAGAAIAAAGMLTDPRTAVTGVALGWALAFAGARRAGLLMLALITGAAVAGIRLEDLPPAVP